MSSTWNARRQWHVRWREAGRWHSRWLNDEEAVTRLLASLMSNPDAVAITEGHRDLGPWTVKRLRGEAAA